MSLRRPEVGRSGTSPPDVGQWLVHTVDAVGDGVFVVDDAGVLVYANPAALRISGADALNSDPAKWPEGFGIYLADEKTPYPADELPLVLALRGKRVVDVELFLRSKATPKGVHLEVSATPVRDPSGKTRGAAVIFRDITDRRERRRELKEGERQTKAILDNIPDIAWLKDRGGRFVAVNHRLAQAAGKSRPEEVVGLTDFDLWPRELAEGYRVDDEYVMRTGQHKRIEEQFVDARGKTYWIETIKTRIVGDDGEVIGTTGIARDITERKRDEEALRLTKHDLERRVAERTAELAEAQENLVRKERLAVLGQLAGGVAHQIRNPLAAIMNTSYILRRHLPPEQHQNVENAIRIIHDEVRHANVIITGLLDYARVRTPDRHPGSIPELVERVLSGDWIPKEVRIERHIDEDIPLLDVDADQLHGAIFNIVRNAVEAMESGGILRVEVHVLDGETLVVSIGDSGPGISPQVRSHLFEPLHSTKPMGIGLGLVTARTFVEAHGGRILNVDVPKGALFEIRLPLR